jgi:hemerythrin-like domain-containing protein
MKKFSSWPQHEGQVDIYRRIHKALRACLCDTLARVGRMDSGDPQEVSAVLAQVRSMAAFCESHVTHENEFVHTAMEARFPGSSEAIAAEHEQHRQACRKIAALAGDIEQARSAERPAVAGKLYQYIALFLADSLVHMNAEETEHNTLLWATHSDAELVAIEQAIVASLTPEEKALSMRWMLPSLNPAERIELLEGMRRGMPAEAFSSMLVEIRALLAPGDWRKLSAGLQFQHVVSAPAGPSARTPFDRKSEAACTSNEHMNVILAMAGMTCVSRG